MAIQRDTKWNVILWGFFFLFYYYNWSSCFLFLPMWLTRMVGLDKTHIGKVFSSFAVAAICLQPLLGWVTDKLGPKKYLLWLIVILMVLFAPFFIYVYTPLLQSHFAIGLVVGGLYLGFIFHAGYGAVEAFVEKVSRNRGFEYGRPRLFGCFGSAACATISGILYGFDPTWIYWIGSALALLLVVILLVARSEPLPGIEAEQVRQQKVSVWELFKLRRFWYFTLYVLGVACIYDVFDQQFINFFTRFFDHQEQATRAFGYITTAGNLGDAAVMFFIPLLINKYIGSKNALLITGTIMTIRIVGSSFATGPIEVLFLRMLHNFEVPFLLIGIFKYITDVFDTRLSGTIYLVGVMFIKQSAAIVLSTVAGHLYDTIGFHNTYLILGSITAAFTLLSAFLLTSTPRQKTADACAPATL
ncbi:oligosaccharide MFS transporter [Klebsiella michiganensis]|uniref:oligosaccharide MFS transporter n=1 Tax=Klebsiella michiganensis TaxID=1134687 RepID=UPI002929E08F|nr:oligosaccharide MFS transporter [Klebsiella michiganensis]MDV0342578.1 oligosaccharide MFS transporter [Klebsiella michiganensis]MDV0358108.1 oligosaccharide MFS transporter [Klebsiella michiganensis]MDV0406289.1 oligosaccharide MFS transporter [Klebsiella michiganensis]